MNIYHAHSSNLRALNKILIHLARSIKRALRNKQNVVAAYLTKTYALLLGAWAECRQCKLLEMHNGFSQRQRDYINKARTVKNRWDRLVEVAFKHHYAIKKITERTLNHTTHARYTTILQILDEHLYPIIQLRNKLAHGQVEYPLNSDNTDVSTELMRTLMTENILSLQHKRNLLGHITDLVECLVASRPAFEANFDCYFERILDVTERVKKIDFNKYLDSLNKSTLHTSTP